MSLDSRPSVREAAIAALCVPELAAIVDLVTWVESVDGVVTAHAANHHGLSLIHISEPTRPY